jgi:hypothetical protein
VLSALTISNMIHLSILYVYFFSLVGIYSAIVSDLGLRMTPEMHMGVIWEKGTHFLVHICFLFFLKRATLQLAEYGKFETALSGYLIA